MTRPRLPHDGRFKGRADSNFVRFHFRLLFTHNAMWSGSFWFSKVAFLLLRLNFKLGCDKSAGPAIHAHANMNQPGIIWTSGSEPPQHTDRRVRPKFGCYYYNLRHVTSHVRKLLFCCLLPGPSRRQPGKPMVWKWGLELLRPRREPHLHSSGLLRSSRCSRKSREAAERNSSRIVG